MAPIAAAAVDAQVGGAHAPAAVGADDDGDAEENEGAAILPVTAHTAHARVRTGPQLSVQACSVPAHYSPRPCPPALLPACARYRKMSFLYKVVVAAASQQCCSLTPLLAFPHVHPHSSSQPLTAVAPLQRRWCLAALLPARYTYPPSTGSVFRYTLIPPPPHR